MDAATNEIKTAILAAGLPYRPCGLNADWCVDAWHLSEGAPNTTSGDLYLLDDEQGTYEIVRRYYNDDAARMDGSDDHVETLAAGLSLAAALTFARAVK